MASVSLARVLGREIQPVINRNPVLKSRLQKILNEAVHHPEDSNIPLLMIGQYIETIADAVDVLKNIAIGMSEEQPSI